MIRTIDAVCEECGVRWVERDDGAGRWLCGHCWSDLSIEGPYRTWRALARSVWRLYLAVVSLGLITVGIVAGLKGDPAHVWAAYFGAAAAFDLLRQETDR